MRYRGMRILECGLSGKESWISEGRICSLTRNCIGVCCHKNMSIPAICSHWNINKWYRKVMWFLFWFWDNRCNRYMLHTTVMPGAWKFHNTHDFWYDLCICTIFVSCELKCFFLLISDLIVANIFVCSLVVAVNSPAERTSCMWNGQSWVDDYWNGTALCPGWQATVWNCSSAVMPCFPAENKTFPEENKSWTTANRQT